MKSIFRVIASASLSACCITATPVPAAAQDVVLGTVVIDAGHGGTDPGCISRDGKTMEKDVTLAIAGKLSDKIQAAYPEINVVMTRNSDTYVSLADRGKRANGAGGDLFISIHVNSVEKGTKANGFSIHCLGQSSRKGNDLFSKNLELCKRENSVIKLDEDQAQYQGFDPDDPQSYIFFSLIQNAHLGQSLVFAEEVASEMASGGPISNNRGVSQDPFYVLWTTAMPAVLIEVGFMTNPEDLGTMRTEIGRDGIAEAIFRAFTTYKGRYDNNDASLPPQQTVAPAEADGPAGEIAENGGVSPRYGIQILAIGKKMSMRDPYFNGCTPMEIRTPKLYKYVVETGNSLEAVRKKYPAIKKKFPDSYIVKIEDDNTVPVK